MILITNSKDRRLFIQGWPKGAGSFCLWRTKPGLFSTISPAGYQYTHKNKSRLKPKIKAMKKNIKIFYKTLFLFKQTPYLCKVNKTNTTNFFLMVLQSATFTRKYRHLLATYQVIQDNRDRETVAGDSTWKSLTRSVDRLMSDIMDIECGFKPDRLMQLRPQVTATRINGNYVRVSFRFNEYDGAQHFHAIDIPANGLRLTDKYDRQQILRMAKAQMATRGYYWAIG